MSDAIVKKVQQEWIESCSKIISKAQGCPAQLYWSNPLEETWLPHPCSHFLSLKTSGIIFACVYSFVCTIKTIKQISHRLGFFCFQVIRGLNSSVVKSRRFCSILEDNIFINSHGKIDLFFIQYPNHLSNEVSGIEVGACPSRYRTKRKVHSATHTHTIHSCPYTHLQYRGTNQCSIALHVSDL